MPEQPPPADSAVPPSVPGEARAGAPRLGAWLASGSLTAAEISATSGAVFTVIDAEHGAIDDTGLNVIIPMLKSLGQEVLVKVRSTGREAIQRPLDFGADGVIVPHVLGVDHAREVCGFAKFPPLGDRSLAAERALGYASLSPEWIAAQDVRTRCYAMIEDATALEEIEEIVALDVVDGVFPGPSDLAIRRGRGCYSRSVEDFADLRRIADACAAVGKPWILPAWHPAEQEFAMAEGAAGIVVANEYTALSLGFTTLVADARTRLTRSAPDDPRPTDAP
ncbi:HpcH/HpaI aldolase/citrate lyase family protein [Streptomyces sp. NPDC050433]|uniref:HpcH/HpaI aldolase/citrate lyase family protein n=1 Tax=Streptomyces sp. NPDC050433 TaxID=3365615 RepID=UPI00379ABF37